MAGYLSVPAAAALLGYHPATVKRLIARGVLRSYRATPRSHPRVKRAEIEALMEQGAPVAGATDLDVAWRQVFLG